MWLSGLGEEESNIGNRKYSQGKIFYCFHTLFLFFGSMATSQSGKDAAVLFLLP